MSTIFEDDKGNSSLGRIISISCIAIGTAVILAGLIAFFMKYAEAIQLIYAGSGVIALGAGGKTISKFAEQEK